MIASLAGFLMGFIGSMPLAGPTSLLVFHRGMLARYRDGWAIGLGGGLAEGIYYALAVHGFSILHDNLTFLAPLTKVASVLLLLALALYFIFARQRTPEKCVAGELSTPTWKGQFCIGLTIATFNPTLLLTWSASVAMVLPIINLTLHGHERITFATSIVIGIVAWFSIFLALLRLLKGRFPFSSLQSVIHSIGLGLVLISMVSAAALIFGWPLSSIQLVQYVNTNKWLVL
jgi:threonine/homoserine/homoserine lactone efflux protein